MRLGVLVDGKIKSWQLDALDRLIGDHEIYLLETANQPSKRSLKFGLYYALNVFTIRNRLTRKVDVSAERLNAREVFAFSCEFEGAWASLPQGALDWIAEKKLDAIIKFGLGLLRVPPATVLSAPILSFHHGDPREYRGRPAGFYELLHGKAFMGQMVQSLGAKLDGGAVYAFAETPVVSHSYRKTLMQAYRLSPYLLAQAVENVRLRRPLPIGSQGRNYRLPSNGTVARFVAQRLWQSAKRAAYGAFMEKRWRVATARVQPSAAPTEAAQEAEAGEWSVVPLSSGFSFYADPFFGTDENEIFVEAFNALTGKGEVVQVRDGQQQTLSGFGGHVSYPATLLCDGKRLIIPETSSWSGLTAFEVVEGKAEPVRALDVEPKDILDPTFLRHEGQIYLFGNVKQEGSSVLHLWFAEDIFAPFKRHPASPIRVSGRGSRMAGEVAEWNGALYRFGQDWKHSYGSGVMVFRIERLNTNEYAEEPAGEIAFAKAKGPHTVNRRGGALLFDYYHERFSPLAGVRRLLGKF